MQLLLASTVEKLLRKKAVFFLSFISDQTEFEWNYGVSFSIGCRGGIGLTVDSSYCRVISFASTRFYSRIHSDHKMLKIKKMPARDKNEAFYREKRNRLD